MQPLEAAQVEEPVLPVSRPSPLRRLAGFAAKIGIVGATFGYLFYTGCVDLHKLAALWQNSPSGVLLAFLAIAATTVLCGLRYYLLLIALRLPCTLRRAISFTMIGSFFDLAMPLSNGGDIIKAVYVTRYAGNGRRGLAVLSVMLDRVIGLFALMVFAAMICVYAGHSTLGTPALQRVAYWLPWICMAIVVMFLITISPHLERSTLRQWLVRRLPFHERIEALYLAFAGLRKHWVLLLAMLGLSLIVQWCCAMSIFWLAEATPFTVIATGQPGQAAFVPSLIIIPLGLLANTFGAFGGLGVGELAFEELYRHLLGLSGGTQLALAFHIVAVLARLVGLPFVLAYKHAVAEPVTEHAGRKAGIPAAATKELAAE